MRKVGHINQISASFTMQRENTRKFSWRLLPVLGDNVRIQLADADMFFPYNNKVWTVFNNNQFMKNVVCLETIDRNDTGQLFSLTPAVNLGWDRIVRDSGFFMEGQQMWSSNGAYWFEISHITHLPSIYEVKSGGTLVWELQVPEKPEVAMALRLETATDRLMLRYMDRLVDLEGTDPFHQYCVEERPFWDFTFNAAGEDPALILGDDGVLRLQAGSKLLWSTPSVRFRAIYKSGLPGKAGSGNGIGSFDLKHFNDRAFAFDWESKGVMDHIVFHNGNARRDTHIVGKVGDKWQTKYSQPAMWDQDLYGLAFDYESKGKMDHILFYDAGSSGRYTLVRVQAGKLYSFALGNGMGLVDLKKWDDKIIAFDYEHSGKMDHLLCYRPGSGLCTIVKNAGSSRTSEKPFNVVFESSNGIGPYDLLSSQDKIIAFDWDNGKMDHLVCYRPGSSTIWFLRNSGGAFEKIMEGQGGLAGYDLKDYGDKVFAYDWRGSGRQDRLICTRFAQSPFWCMDRSERGFRVIYNEVQGPGGFNLNAHGTHMFTMDVDKSGKQKEIVMYVPGEGIIWILKRH